VAVCMEEGEEDCAICLICQTETRVHENERYKCVEMQCQDIDNQGGMSCNRKAHMERNKNLIYDCDRDSEKGNKETQKYTKNDNRETLETNNQMKIYF